MLLADCPCGVRRGLGVLPTALQVPPGQFVLFNGASFLADLSASGLQVGCLLAAEPHPLGSLARQGSAPMLCCCPSSPSAPRAPSAARDAAPTALLSEAPPQLRLPPQIPPSRVHRMQLPDERAAELLGGAQAHPLDPLALRKYKGLVEQYGFAGGIYVQVGLGRFVGCWL